MNRRPPEIAARWVFARVPLGSRLAATKERSEDVDRGQAVLSSSSHSTTLTVTVTVTDSVVANASIGPWISRSYNRPLIWGHATGGRVLRRMPRAD